MASSPLAPVEREVGPGTTANFSQADPSAFGADVGRAVSGLGESAENYALTVQRVQKNEQNAQASLGLEQALQDTDTFARNDQMTQDPNGHQDRVAAFYSKATGPLADSIDSPQLRTEFQSRVVANQTNVDDRAWSFETAKKAAQVALNVKQANTLQGSALYRSDSLPDLSSAMDRNDAMIEALDTSPENKAALHYESKQSLYHDFLDGQVQRNPQQAKALIASGAFDSVGAEGLKILNNNADVEIRRADAVQQHQVELQKQAVREQHADIQARTATGQVVSAAELSQAEAAAHQINDPAMVTEIHALRISNGLNRETQPWGPADFNRNIDALLAKGDKRSPDEDTQLKYLQELAPKRAAEFDHDPGAWGALNGMPPTTLDPADPTSIAARAQWQATISASQRRPVGFLLPDEVGTMKAQMVTPAGKAGVIDQLANLGGQRAMLAAQQVDPNDQMMARAVMLPPDARGSALAGAAARKLNPALVDGSAKDGGTKTLATEQITTRLGSAAALLDPHEVEAVRQTALNIYADHMTKNGLHDFSAPLLNTSIHQALAGTRGAQGQWYGGVGSWNGNPVLLPQAMSQQGFEADLSRLGWKSGDPNGPVWRAGQPMSADQVRKFTPVLRPDGRYEFHGPTAGDIVHGHNGGIWTIGVGTGGRP